MLRFGDQLAYLSRSHRAQQAAAIRVSHLHTHDARTRRRRRSEDGVGVTWVAARVGTACASSEQWDAQQTGFSLPQFLPTTRLPIRLDLDGYPQTQDRDFPFRI